MTKYRVYHGSGSLFEQFKSEYSRVANDHFGGMLYFTDNKKVAEQYASAGFRKNKQKVIYEVELDIKNLFDVEKTYTGNELLKLLRNINLEDFARKSGLLKYGVDKYQIIADLKSGKISLTGEQIFLGLSGGQQETAKTRNALKKAGYDGLKYYGAKIFGSIPHIVYLPYNLQNIKIVNTTLQK